MADKMRPLSRNLAELKKKIEPANAAVCGTARNSGEWSDTAVEDYAKAHPMPETNMETHLNWAVEFINFYLFGKREFLNKPVDIIAKAVSGISMKTVDGKITTAWKHREYLPNWIYEPKTMADTVKLQQGASTSEADHESLKKRLKESGKYTDEQINAHMEKYYDKTSNDSFLSDYSYVLEKARKSTDDQEAITARLVILNTTGFIAASLLRILGKSLNSVSAMFFKKSFHANMAKYGNWSSTNFIGGPCKACFDSLPAGVSKGDSGIRAVMAHFLSIKLDPNAQHMDGFGNAAFLAHLQYNGLLPVMYLTQLIKKSGMEIQLVVEGIWCNHTSQYLTVFINFLNRYNDSKLSTHSKLWVWSRAFDDGYFPELRVDMGTATAAICAGALSVLDPETYEGIMDAVWMSKINATMRDKYLDYGRNLANLRMLNIETIEENQELLTRVNPNRGVDPEADKTPVMSDDEDQEQEDEEKKDEKEGEWDSLFD